MFFDHTPEGTPTPEEEIAAKIHMTGTTVFVISQVIYLFFWVSIFNGNKDKFKGFETHLGALNFFRTSLTAFALYCWYAESSKIPGAWGVFLEWVAFDYMFMMYMVMINIMPFKDSFAFE